ncbi:hypothetical protein [Fontivita pretiosa]|uniref:hypothetical protein n=1 Tax=Fontivita pretiosa TaxID=2989684 RepID=UPI003D1761BD
MHRAISPLSLCLLVWVCNFCAAQEPTTSPATDTLLDGKLVYTPPPGWQLLGKFEDRRVGYGLGEGRAHMTLLATPQQNTIPDELAPKLAARIRQTILQEQQRGNLELVLEPRVEPDPRFLLRVHDRYHAQGKFGDRLQLFRGIGRNLVSVTVVALTDNEQEAAQIHEAAETAMQTVHLAGTKPPVIRPRPRSVSASAPASAPADESIVLREARLRITPPAGWTAQLTANISGLLATWRDPQEPANVITLIYRPIPEQAKTDSRLRDLAIEELARAEKPSFQIEGAQPAGQTQTIADKRFLRKLRTEYSAREMKFVLTMRQVRAGDGVASITSIALPDKADEIDALADRVAMGVRALPK